MPFTQYAEVYQKALFSKWFISYTYLGAGAEHVAASGLCEGIFLVSILTYWYPKGPRTQIAEILIICS